MKVRDIMTQTAVCCGPETNVGAAVEIPKTAWLLTVRELRLNCCSLRSTAKGAVDFSRKGLAQR